MGKWQIWYYVFACVVYHYKIYIYTYTVSYIIAENPVKKIYITDGH